MATRPAAYDALIVGAGPAGSACATLLARGGARVLLVDGGLPRQRPAEVLGPDTLRMIRELGLAAPDDGAGARPCRGLLSLWGGRQEHFHDYALYGCESALAVDRHAFDTRLVDGATSCGVTVVAGRPTRPGRGATPSAPSARGDQGSGSDAPGWDVTIGAVRVWARLLVDASGRSGRAVPIPGSARRFSDGLVCLSTVHGADSSDDDLLLLEAVQDGWWYASRHANGATVAFLSDTDLLPRTRAARTHHLERSFAATRMLRERLVSTPVFGAHVGHDARTGRRQRTSGPAWLAVGDAAFSSDPLSGEGTRLALLSAQAAATAATAWLRGGGRSALDTFSAWCDQTHADQTLQRQHAYASVDPAWHSAAFWRRRI